MEREAVVLDVGGVLLLPHAEPVCAALAALGLAVDPARTVRAHYAGVRALDEAAGGPEERRSYLRAYARALGAPEARLEEATEALRRVWTGPLIELWRQPVPGSREALERLAATGRKLAIVSNADGSVEEQLRAGDICQVGEGLGVPVLAIIDSGVVGVSKPAAEIFGHALETLGVTPERAVYVGDTVTYDVRGARAAGLRPVHMDPFALCAQPGDHAHVRSLAEVEGLLAD